MFIHPGFPAQFRHIAFHASRQLGWEVTFVTSVDTTQMKLPFTHINYRVKEGPLPKVFRDADRLADLEAHMSAIYAGLRGLDQLKPDLVVGHMSFGTMLYLRNLYDCPFLGYYEYLPAPFWSEEFVLREDFPPTEEHRLFNATYHAFTYLHLHACDACYTPTAFQRGTAPAALRDKIRVVFDGVDTELNHPQSIDRPCEFLGTDLPAGTKVVTYCSRGLEAIRGFDIFMQVARRICEARDDVVFLVAGEERTYYGHELAHIGRQSFRQHVLAEDDYDLSRIRFLGRIPPRDLARMLQLSDLHVYLTVPYVLSWSLVQAMSTGCTILASATAPVQEVIEDGVHGILCDFRDVDALAARAIEVLDDPGAHRYLGEAARRRVLEEYDKRVSVPRLAGYFTDVAAG